ncbi:MAG: spermidine synthase [Pseudomonadota bacterium]
MNPWKLIDTSEIPNGGGELRLYQRGEEHTIMIAGEGELMSSRLFGSEQALAELGCGALGERDTARVLVGGLGMGYTLAATLRELGPDAEVVVAELVPAVVRWNRDYLGGYARHPLNDPRTTIREGDIARILKRERGAFDAVLLDVDNGPEGMTRRENDWLYGRAGLAAAWDCLRPGGVLAVWSAGPDRTFSERLRTAGFEVTVHTVRAHAGKKGARHTIWLAARA